MTVHGRAISLAEVAAFEGLTTREFNRLLRQWSSPEANALHGLLARVGSLGLLALVGCSALAPAAGGYLPRSAVTGIERKE